jgi:hypothetical protein
MVLSPLAMYRDFPDSLMPTAVAGLFDDSSAFPHIGKPFPGAGKRPLACRRAVMLPVAPFIRASGPGTGRPVPSPLHLPAVSSYVGVIPAPAAALVVTSCLPVTSPRDLRKFLDGGHPVAKLNRVETSRRDPGALHEGLIDPFGPEFLKCLYAHKPGLEVGHIGVGA